MWPRCCCPAQQCLLQLSSLFAHNLHLYLAGSTQQQQMLCACQQQTLPIRRSQPKSLGQDHVRPCTHRTGRSTAYTQRQPRCSAATQHRRQHDTPQKLPAVDWTRYHLQVLFIDRYVASAFNTSPCTCLLNYGFILMMSNSGQIQCVHGWLRVCLNELLSGTDMAEHCTHGPVVWMPCSHKLATYPPQHRFYVRHSSWGYAQTYSLPQQNS